LTPDDEASLHDVREDKDALCVVCQRFRPWRRFVERLQRRCDIAVDLACARCQRGTQWQKDES